MSNQEFWMYKKLKNILEILVLHIEHVNLKRLALKELRYEAVEQKALDHYLYLIQYMLSLEF